MALQQSPERLDTLFVHDIAELERLGRITPRTEYALLQMSAIVRRLCVDEQPLAQHAAARCTTPLVVLIPEPVSGHPNYDPARTFPAPVMKYAPEISEKSHPGGVEGFFHRPYSMAEYLKSTHMVLPHTDKAGALRGRSISPKEMILYFANKLGGVHVDKNLVDLADGGRSVDAETLHTINSKVSFFGQEVLIHQFGVVGERIWRACAPLRDELISKAKS